MGVRCVYDSATGTAAMYDSVSGFAFGPLFYDNDIAGETAEELVSGFVGWCGDDDPRGMRDGDLEERVIQYLRNVERVALAQTNASFT